MEKKDLIELTVRVYKITLLFPKKEPLRYKVRAVADKIPENFISWELIGNPVKRDKFFVGEEIKKDIEVINSYLEVAKWQNWVTYFDILSLMDEYDKIKDSFPQQEVIKFEPPKVEIDEPVVSGDSGEVKKESINENRLTNRKKQILEILKAKEAVQVWEINKILSNVSKRTLRRDFEQLLKDGYVQRIGERNKTFYKLA